MFVTYLFHKTQFRQVLFASPYLPKSTISQVARAIYLPQVHRKARLTTQHIPYPASFYLYNEIRGQTFPSCSNHTSIPFISENRYPSFIPQLQGRSPFRTSKVYNLQFILELLTPHDQDNSFSQAVG